MEFECGTTEAVRTIGLQWGIQNLKNKGLAILFGLMPGAGHMYLAKMKRGMTLLILFWGDIALAAAMGMSLLLMALPVLWFYSFFDNLNLALPFPGGAEGGAGSVFLRLL